MSLEVSCYTCRWHAQEHWVRVCLLCENLSKWEPKKAGVLA